MKIIIFCIIILIYRIDENCTINTVKQLQSYRQMLFAYRSRALASQLTLLINTRPGQNKICKQYDVM